METRSFIIFDYLLFYFILFILLFFFFFFFQAEDGIRDLTVTGVQTCALPISHALNVVIIVKTNLQTHARAHVVLFSSDLELPYNQLKDSYGLRFQLEIGRASCRERV